MPTNPLVLLDFDTTLFNTRRFFVGLEERLAVALGQTQPAVQVEREAYIATLPDITAFDPTAFIASLAAKFQANEADLLAIYTQPDFYPPAVFPEVLMVLETLRKQEITLGVFSQGVKKWQEKKLVESGLINYFDHNHIYISADKTNPDFLKSFTTRTLVVDDKQEVVEKLLPFSVFVPVWINRFSEEKWANGPTIFSLTGVIPLVKHLAE